MNARTILRAGLLAALLAALPVYAATVSRQASPSHEQKRDVASATQTASGKIAAVASDGFTLEVSEGTTSQTLRFVTDSNTKMRGKLQQGSTASVEYYTDNSGRNVATTVVVESAG
jgi:hypothetical protein